MLLDSMLAYLHFVCIIAAAALLFVELALLRPALADAGNRLIARFDIAYFIAAIAALGTGLSRAVWGAKGWAFYQHNPAFHAKVGLFVVIALISIAPTRQFLRWAGASRRDAAYRVPAAELKRARRFVLIEIHLLMLLPLLAAMMSRHLWF